PTSSTPITAAVVLEPPTSSGRFIAVITSRTARPTSPGPGATRVCQVLVSTRLRRKYTTTATDVSVISAMMPTEEIPTNQANTWVTRSRPASAEAATRTSAETVGTAEAMCGEACLAWLWPHFDGRAPVLPSEKT